MKTSNMKRTIIIFSFLIILSNVYSQGLVNKINSSTGYFYLYVPKDWEDVSKYNDLCIDSFSYKISESSFFTITSIDIFDLYKNSPQMKGVTRAQLSYNAYTRKTMYESLENWVLSYTAQLQNNHPDIKIIEKKVSYIDHQPSIYLKITYGYENETIIQEVFDLMFMGIDTKFTYFYNTKEKNLVSLFEKVISSIKY